MELVVEVLVHRRCGAEPPPLLLCYDEVHRFARSRRILAQLSHLNNVA